MLTARSSSVFGPKFDTSRAPFQGRQRLLRARDLQPLHEGLRAFALWRSVPRVVVEEPLWVMAGPSKGWVWFAGFGGLTEAPLLLTHALRQPLPEALAREMMWRAAVSGAGVRLEALELWRVHLRQQLPDDMLTALFPRGLGVSAVARHFGLSRPTAARHLRGDHD